MADPSSSHSANANPPRAGPWSESLKEAIGSSNISSQRLFEEINRVLENSGRATVSSSLVRKWRSGHKVPVRAEHATAVVRALEALGVLGGEESQWTVETAEARLIRSLNHSPAELVGDDLAATLRKAQGDVANVVNKLAKVAKGRKTIPSEHQATMAACLISQLQADQARVQHYSKYSKQDPPALRELSLLRYDSRDTVAAEDQRAGVLQEIHGITKSLDPKQPRRWSIVLCLLPELDEYTDCAASLGASGDSSGDPNAVSVWMERVQGIMSGRACRGLPKLATEVHAKAAAKRGSAELLYLVLTPHEAFRFTDMHAILDDNYPNPTCWSVVRHPDLYKLVGESRESTFVSSVAPQAAKYMLEELGVKHSSAAREWYFERAERIPLPAAQASRAERGVERGASSGKGERR